MLFWAGSAVEIAGSQIRLVVLPVLVFQLTGSAAQTSILLTLVLLPYLVFGLVAGAVADRANRRLLMIGCDLVAAIAVVSIPVAAAAGTLTLTHIYLTAVLTGVTFVWHDAAQFGALPAIVGRARVAAAYGALISSDQVLNIGATALGGVLIATVGPATALWIDGASYAVAALTLALIPRPFGRAVRAVHGSAGQPWAARLLPDIREGLRYVRRHRLIWPLTATGWGLGLTSGAVLGLLVVYGVRQLCLAEDDEPPAALHVGLLVRSGHGGVEAADEHHEEGRADDRGDDAEGDLGGRQGDAGDHVGPDQEDRADEGRHREDSTVLTTDEPAREVGHDEADECDGAGHGDDGAHADRDQHEHLDAEPGRVGPESEGGLVADRQRIETATPRQEKGEACRHRERRHWNR